VGVGSWGGGKREEGAFLKLGILLKIKGLYFYLAAPAILEVLIYPADDRN
jgi:hypothetical protein